jgi:hypothetical protein
MSSSKTRVLVLSECLKHFLFNDNIESETIVQRHLIMLRKVSFIKTSNVRNSVAKFCNHRSWLKSTYVSQEEFKECKRNFKVIIIIVDIFVFEVIYLIIYKRVIFTAGNTFIFKFQE